MTNLKQQYQKEIIPALQEKFGYKNVMAIPKISKAIINVGIGRIVKEDKKIEHIISDIAKITGQKPVTRKAKKSIAGFKVREGMDSGLVVTLRGKRMYDFIERLIRTALPRSRDFRGLKPSSLDGWGNLNIGIKEHMIFPEVSYESAKDIFGFQVTIVSTAKNKEEALELFKLLGLPFAK